MGSVPNQIALLFALLISTGMCRGAETVSITTGDYLPYSSQEMRGDGLTMHIIREAFRLEGYELKLVFMPWKRAWDEALNNEAYDGTAYWFPSEKRAAHFDYSDPILSEEYVLFHLNALPLREWKTLQDLSGYTFGATAGYTYTPEFHELAASGELRVEFVARDVLGFRMLLRRHVDLVPADMLGGYYLLHREFAPAAVSLVTFNPQPMLVAKQHLLFKKNRPRNEELRIAFNRGLGQLHESGVIDDWINELLQGGFDRPAASPVRERQ